MRPIDRLRPLLLGCALWLSAAWCVAEMPAAEPSQPFLLGGIQANELDHAKWMAGLDRHGMNAVQVTVYAQQGAWNSAQLWYDDYDLAVVNEIRAARADGVQVLLVLRVALNHYTEDNRFLWHGLIFPETDAQMGLWFRRYEAFVTKWAEIAEAEGVEMIAIGSELNSLGATIPIDEIPNLPAFYLDPNSQIRLSNLLQRLKPVFTEDVRRSMNVSDIDSLDELLSQRSVREQAWARAYTFDDVADPIAAMNERRQRIEAEWRRLIANVREVYGGFLTFAANHDNYHEVGFWDALDWIGINAYFALRPRLEPPPDVAMLEAAWRDVFGQIDAFQTAQGLDMPIVFTELGYTRLRGTSVAPWAAEGFVPLWSPDEDTSKDDAFFWALQPTHPHERALAVRALRNVWETDDVPLRGIFYWKLSTRASLMAHEPFMIHLGHGDDEPALVELKRFAADARPLGPRPGTPAGPARVAHEAVLSGDLDALRAVDADVLRETRVNGRPLLHLAVALGHGAIAQHLLDRGAARDSRDAGGRLPIHWVCHQGDPSWARVLAEDVPQPWIDARGETPLMQCMRRMNLTVARALFRAGDRLNQANEDGTQALHIALDHDDRAVVDWLIEVGADVNAFDEEGTTPLHLAARRWPVDLIDALMRSGAEHRADINGDYPIDHAAFHGRSAIFHRLFTPERVPYRNRKEHTLLHHAARGGAVDILKTLLPHYDDIDHREEEGWAALSFAIGHDQVEAARVLLAHGASSDFRNHVGVSPLHLAAARNHTEILALLVALDCDADVNVLDMHFNAALHYAAGWENIESIRMLLDAGADVSIRNLDDDTPLGVAEKFERYRAINELRTVNASRVDQQRGAP
ncbi:MAG: ankyrin repeat domain-containing protein [Acidobacteriota bacterium]